MLWTVISYHLKLIAGKPGGGFLLHINQFHGKYICLYWGCHWEVGITTVNWRTEQSSLWSCENVSMCWTLCQLHGAFVAGFLEGLWLDGGLRRSLAGSTIKPRYPIKPECSKSLLRLLRRRMREITHYFSFSIQRNCLVKGILDNFSCSVLAVFAEWRDFDFSFRLEKNLSHLLDVVAVWSTKCYSSYLLFSVVSLKW